MIRPSLALLAFMLAQFFAMPAAVGQQNPLSTISIKTSAGHESWTIELASTERARQKGLMHRRHLPRNAGMLFRFDETQPVTMWMKNTFIALDMIFMDEQGRIKHIHRHAVPQSLDIITSGGPVRYVLEVNAGEVARVGLKAGNMMLHPWFAASK